MDAQRGMAVVLGVLGSALLLVLGLHLYQVGKHLRQAHQLRTALDAAAYSGAVVQSRTLNALSLLNRAYIGHQIASAHILTLAAWAHWAQKQAAQATIGNPPIWLIEGFFGSSYGQAYHATQRVPHLSDLIKRLRAVFTAQQEFNGTYYEHFVHALEEQTRRTRNAVIAEVLARNLSLTSVEESQIEFLNDHWHDLLTQFSPEQGIHWVRSLQQHYAFLKQRARTVRSAFPVSDRCPHLRHQLRRMGQTYLDAQGRWSVEDSLSFHALRSNRWIGCYYREYAMGWAWQPEQGATISAPYSTDAPANFADIHFWRWVNQQSGWGHLSEGVNPLANSYAVRDKVDWQAEPFRSLSYAQHSQFSFVLQARIQLGDENFTAQSGAISRFSLPFQHRWRRSLMGHEQAWFPFWQSALFQYQ